eukprot:Gb_24747 [translate_table: standard]
MYFVVFSDRSMIVGFYRI